MSYAEFRICLAGHYTKTKPNFILCTCLHSAAYSYFSELLEKLDDKLRNPAHTQVNPVVSRRCLTSSQNMWEAICPERNYSALI